jgi:hypothetical protein
MRCGALGLFVAMLAGCGLLPGSYAFDPADLAEIAGQVNATSGEEAVDQAYQALKARGLPVAGELNWLFNTDQGMPTQVAALYVRPNEYLIFGAAPAVAGWSMGPFLDLQVWDFVLFGDLNAYQAGELNPPLLGPGDQAILPAGDVKNYQTTSGVWVLEYGRGLYPETLYAGSFASDFPIAEGVVVYTASTFINSLIRNFVSDAFGLPPGLSSLFGL